MVYMELPLIIISRAVEATGTKTSLHLGDPEHDEHPRGCP